MAEKAPQNTFTTEDVARQTADLMDGSDNEQLKGIDLSDKKLDEIVSLVQSEVGKQDFNPDLLFNALDQVAKETRWSQCKKPQDMRWTYENIASVVFGLEFDKTEQTQKLTKQLGNLMQYSGSSLNFNRVADQINMHSLRRGKTYDLEGAPQYLVAADDMALRGDDIYFVYSGASSIPGGVNSMEMGGKRPSGVVQVDEFDKKMYFTPLQGDTLSSTKIDISDKDDYGLSIIQKNIK